MKKVLIIDNYDSFTYNLFQYLSELGAKCDVFKNDKISINEIREAGYSHIVLSPGPGSPHVKKDVGICNEIITEFYQTIPILGVCLGCQLIAVNFGGKVKNSSEIVHGMRSEIRTCSYGGLFDGLGDSFDAMRYHSLVIDEDTIPKVLKITSRTEPGLIMSIQHENAPLFGVQFHPESIGTHDGHAILQNFLNV